MFVAVWEFCERHGDYSLLHEYAGCLERAINWLSALDANNCGMLEIPEAGDWTDLFARSYNILYDEVCGIAASFITPRFSAHSADKSRRSPMRNGRSTFAA